MLVKKKSLWPEDPPLYHAGAGGDSNMPEELALETGIELIETVTPLARVFGFPTAS